MIPFTDIESLQNILLADWIDAALNRPQLILAGGCSRSGKTTVVMKLCEGLRARQMECVVINLDCWLVGVESRKKGSTVLERYDVDRIVQSAKDIVRGVAIRPPVYDVVSRKRTSEEGPNPIQAERGIIFMEGVVALAISGLRDLAACRIFVDVADDLRLRRLHEFYNVTKGLPTEETKALIHSRELEEVPLIKRSRENADLVFNDNL